MVAVLHDLAALHSTLVDAQEIQNSNRAPEPPNVVSLDAAREARILAALFQATEQAAKLYHEAWELRARVRELAEILR
jgi:hypothetical protein